MFAHDVIDRDAGKKEDRSGERSGYLSGFAPDWSRTSDFMIGRVAVAIVLVESNGVISSSVENWTSTEMDWVEDEIGDALQWWTQQAETQGFDVPLEFVIPSTHPITVETAYEPIQMIGLETPFGEANVWISDTMAHLGYSDPGMDHEERVARYDDALREAYQADWAFTIFVVDATYTTPPPGEPDYNGFFAPGTWGLPDQRVTAWASRPGPYLVVNDLSAHAATGNSALLEEVIAHEIGHVFGAADEVWAGGGDCTAGSECDIEFGYLSIENQNCDRTPQCILDRGDCVMRVGNLDYLCPYSAGQVGWWDSDSDGLADPIDTVPELAIIGYPSNPSPSYILEYTADVMDIPWNTTQPGFVSVTINTVSVEYRVNTTSGSWLTALPGDGAWDSPYETSFKLPIFNNGTYTVYLRAANEVDHLSTVVSHTVTINSSEAVYRVHLPLVLRNY